MSSDLKSRAVSATFWSGLDTLARQGLQFGVTLILARLLTPSDYGTVALLAIFIGIVGVFIESGFSTALIQRKDVNDVDISSVFYLNVSIALLAGIALCFGAREIADFYRMPILEPLTWLMAVNLFIGSFGSVQRTLLTRMLDFRRQFIISVAAVCISGAVAIYLAYRGFGIWSLGIQTITATAVSTIMLWLLSALRPSRVFSMKAIRSLFHFGGYLLLAGLLDIIFNRLNTLVIGKFYSARDLGYYSRADETSLGPAALLTATISRVALPVFAAAHHDQSPLRLALRKTITTAMFINIPIMLGMAGTAQTLVLVLFGYQWLPCAPYLAILCLGGILWPLHVLNLYVLMAQGHSHLFFRLEVIKKTVGIVVVGTACFFGMTAIAWSSVLTGLICFAINAHYTGKYLNYGLWAQIADLWVYVVAGCTMEFCVYLVTLLRIARPLPLLLLQILCGAFIYILFCYVFQRKNVTDITGLVLKALQGSTGQRSIGAE
jgi:teichuronic acid exporter